MNLKEKLVDLFGGLGAGLYFVISFLLPLFPMVMVVVSFDLPFWTNFILIALLFIAPTLSSFCFWIVGLIGVIMGPQDVIAIIYYVAFAIACLPTVISIVLTFFSKD